EGPKRHRHLQHDPPVVKLATSRQVRPPPVAEGLDHHLVVAAGKPLEGPARLGGCEACQVGPDRHGRNRIGAAPGRYLYKCRTQLQACSRLAEKPTWRLENSRRRALDPTRWPSPRRGSDVADTTGRRFCWASGPAPWWELSSGR